MANDFSCKAFNKIKVKNNMEIDIRVVAPNGIDTKNYKILICYRESSIGSIFQLIIPHCPKQTGKIVRFFKIHYPLHRKS